MDGDATHELRPIEAFRSYLRLLAGMQLQGKVRRYLDPSDLVQQTLLEAHRAQHTFRGETVAQQMAWLRRILANNLNDALRRLRRKRRDIEREESVQQRIEQSSMRIEAWVTDPEATPGARIGRSEDALRLADAIGRLSAEQQQAVVLRHLHGMSLRDIAEHLDRSEQAVAALVYRGLAELRRLLADGP